MTPDKLREIEARAKHPAFTTNDDVRALLAECWRLRALLGLGEHEEQGELFDTQQPKEGER